MSYSESEFIRGQIDLAIIAVGEVMKTRECGSECVSEYAHEPEREYWLSVERKDPVKFLSEFDHTALPGISASGFRCFLPLFLSSLLLYSTFYFPENVGQMVLSRELSEYTQPDLDSTFVCLSILHIIEWVYFSEDEAITQNHPGIWGEMNFYFDDFPSVLDSLIEYLQSSVQNGDGS